MNTGGLLDSQLPHSASLTASRDVAPVTDSWLLGVHGIFWTKASDSPTLARKLEMSTARLVTLFPSTRSLSALMYMSSTTARASMKSESPGQREGEGEQGQGQLAEVV